ncbi:hypothetical protein NEOLEDRAFT_838867 [Neolentinus lepideus HHB14362 ss-1]|uniref:Uncharacterized protein n=1 Tax=Neolentinus lepideus HHB14362 ss-1 TaxID=1314782 RepID=A0A165P6P7_9AGAM|nr:hypothetical protein NEOLEDRAFT_838867 [Neolentinus lepideus HHB14362 ss-1]
MPTFLLTCLSGSELLPTTTPPNLEVLVVHQSPQPTQCLLDASVHLLLHPCLLKIDVRGCRNLRVPPPLKSNGSLANFLSMTRSSEVFGSRLSGAP